MELDEALDALRALNRRRIYINLLHKVERTYDVSASFAAVLDLSPLDDSEPPLHLDEIEFVDAHWSSDRSTLLIQLKQSSFTVRAL